MKIVKRINTNAAMGIDQQGKEVVVLGKGVGFPKVPYELENMEVVDHVFYNIDSRYAGLITELPQNVLMASSDLVEQAELNLECGLNPNLPITLADHINFAIQRQNKGIQVTTPLAYDVEHLYPLETELGMLALDIIQDYMDVRLPDSEAVIIAMHIVSGEVEGSNLHLMMKSLKMIEEVCNIVEQELHITIDKNSYQYSRLVIHLQYLIQRLMDGSQTESIGGKMLHSMIREYPDIYQCVQKITEYFRKNQGWECNREEMMYLMLHINRVREKNI